MKGSIEVITGPMYSGKSTELIRRLERSQIAGEEIIVFKPSKDTRSNEGYIESRIGTKIKCKTIDKSAKIIDYFEEERRTELSKILSKACCQVFYNFDRMPKYKKTVVGIDEAQFFDDNIIEVCEKLADENIRVIISGLDMDYKRKPFKNISKLLTKADDILKLNAVCVECGDNAIYSYKKENNNKRLEVGDQDKYKALCRKCYIKRVNNDN